MSLTYLATIQFTIPGDGTSTVLKFTPSELFSASLSGGFPDTVPINLHAKPISGFDSSGSNSFTVSFEGNRIVLTFATAPTLNSYANYTVALVFPSE